MSQKRKVAEAEIAVLVETVNTPANLKLYKDSDGKRNSRSQFWDTVAKSIHKDLLGETVRIKYNSLYSDFKKAKYKTQESGGIASNWKHYDLFETNVKNMDDVFLPGVEELGDPHNLIPPYLEHVKDSQTQFIANEKQSDTNITEPKIQADRKEIPKPKEKKESLTAIQSRVLLQISESLQDDKKRRRNSKKMKKLKKEVKIISNNMSEILKLLRKE